MPCHAMTNTFGGPLEPGRRPAAPLPTTNQWRPCVVGRGAAGLRPGSRVPPNVFVMACHDKGPLTCHAERQRSIRGDGWLAGGPGRRPAAPLPTTQVRDWFVVGRGAAGLRPGIRGPPNVFVIACMP